MTTAFDPIDIGSLRLANRIVMAPMTRSRATEGLPTALTAEYYAQRASAGLIISEGIQPSVVGQGYPFTPGLHSQAQVDAWRVVTDAVHAKGGRIFAQLMHAGRVGHPVLLPEGQVPVGPSAVAATGQVFTPEGLKDFITPHALTGDEVRQTIADFATAARNAIAAGFDGIELHGTTGYLIHQFLAPNSNQRTDEWGGSVENRIRFAVETVKAVVAEIGAERTAIRIGAVPFNDISEPEAEPTYLALVAELNKFGLAFLHFQEDTDRELMQLVRKEFTGPFFLNPRTVDRPTGQEDLHLIEDGTADVLTFGAGFLANPDLPARLAAGGPYNEADRATFYGGDAKGYTDYPTLAG
ncbi:alkene reductase [Streptomyces sp. NRRL B-1677]|uniref:Alkene reductase n=1 Tax=Streptomyces klenkii TaxID=1420899 RepID=A0A3B0AP36_9ACTN|nr:MULTISPECIES: alkene reductase [Streptomyces]MBF6049322.1 alkene reductase [Streptomyces sp. NRRL B-1677]RKN62033.1 alkene reductase [Streptomyces klenkii]